MIARELVVDASVALKWIFPEARGETGVAAARRVLLGVREGEYRLRVPPHFVTEVAAVLARETPRTVARDLTDLLRIEMTVIDDPVTLLRAVELAVAHEQHVFDTLYHAIGKRTGKSSCPAC